MLAYLARIGFGLLLALTVALSLLPREVVPAIGVWDKFNHLLAYAALTALGALGFRGRIPLLGLSAGLTVIGAALEGGQAFVPGRSSSLADAVANMVGIALVTLAFSAWRGARRQGSEPRGRPPDDPPAGD